MIRNFKYLAFFKQTALVMIVVMGILGIVPRVDAAFIQSFDSMDQSFQAKELETVRQFLESKAVTNRLEALGYSPEEAQARLSSLSSEEIHQLATNINTLTTGGDGLGVVIAILVIVLLVILILKLTHKQIIIR
jgi:phage regulator Rha-like protein